MSVITNTYLTYDLRGARESLSDMIYQISPEETPFLNAIGKASASAVYEEWQVDELAAAADNAVVEGDEASFSAATPTNRLGNYCQISRKTAIVSGTAEVISKAGRKSEMGYQMAKRSAELKRDIEVGLLQNNVAVAGATATPREAAGFESFIRTNADRGAGGADPTLSGTTQGYPNAAPTDGTQRAFTETILKSVAQSMYTAGAKLKNLYLGAAQKQVASAFAGLSANRWNVGSGASPVAVVGAADVYVSDFGTLTIIATRNQRNRTALFVDPEMVSIAYLRPFFQKPLAPSGDAEKRMILVEWTLKVHNEAAHGVAADLT